MKISICIIAVAIGLLTLSEPVKAQNVQVNCNFAVLSFVYSCELNGVTIPDNENANFVIGGVHGPGQGNADVGRILILFSNIPFVITQLFVAFPNVHEIVIWNDIGLNRIQSNAFANAGNLRLATVSGCSNFTSIQANAFTGALNLHRLDLVSSGIETIHETAFNGLSSLIEFHLNQNHIRRLPVNVFRPLTALLSLFLSNNFIESIDGNLFAHNSEIIGIHISNNGVNAIGRNFFDGIPRLQFFNMLDNVCINNFFTIGGSTTIEMVRQALSTCFDNFGDDVKRFELVVSGKVIISDQDGNEIIRL